MSDLIPLSEAKKRSGKARQNSRRQAPKPDDEISVAVEKLNKSYAFVLMGGDGWVLRDTQDWDGRPAVEFLAVSAFRMRFDIERYLDGETDRVAGIGTLWMKHPRRETYDGVAMAPEGVPPGWYNLWRGWAVEPAPKARNPLDHVDHFPNFHDHIKRNVARGNVDHEKWIWGWFAQMFQQPTKKPGTALVVRGEKGSGKSKVGEVFGSLLGSHHVTIDQPKHLTGGFNGHMANALLLQAEEGFWAGDPVADGRLKSLITSHVQLLEKKGVDATPIRNLIRLIVTSNSDWVVPASFDERRFAVFDVGNENRQDHKFFEKIDTEMDAGGRSHLLAYLLAYDLKSVDVRVIPSTSGLFEQKIASMTELQAWWMDRLREGRLLSQHEDWRREISTDALFRSFRAYSEMLKSKARLPSKEQFGIALRKVMPAGFKGGQKVWVKAYGPNGEELHNADKSRTYKRVSGYHIPDLAECRQHFEDLVRWPIDWGSDPEAPQPSGEPSEDFELTD